MKVVKRIISGLLLLLSFYANAGKVDYLKGCWQKQVKPLQGKYFGLSFTEDLNELYHSPEPWMQLNYKVKGKVWLSVSGFLKQDTLTSGQRTLYSKTDLSKIELLLLDYGQKDQGKLTTGMLWEQMLQTARYTPAILINYALDQKITPDKESNNEFAVYRTVVDKTIVSLYIRKADLVLNKITMLANDDLRGDLLSTLVYSDYSTFGNILYPATVRVEKVNGRIKDELKLANAAISDTKPDLLDRPADYEIKKDIEKTPELKTEQYSKNIWFIDLLHTGSKVMVVEFNDFLLVSEAPLNSLNGELVINEVHKIAPGKEIRYFTFSHHHPDYTGGMRAFVHKGVTVLSVKSNEEYLRYLSSAPHTIVPDSQQLQPHPLNFREVKDSLRITDGNYEMRLYFIGERSGHTKDYTIFYFPKEKLLVEGDLVWIDKEGAPKKAGKYQAGLYQAIIDLGLDVETIVQTWGIQFEDTKTVIPFKELEQSVKME